ncbi:hypothetical protein IKG07_00205 [Candidatus Saccharibacteria bacterium]|nr:hypothetical protein [Candidatus Saccharibacteria bacterium]
MSKGILRKIVLGLVLFFGVSLGLTSSASAAVGIGSSGSSIKAKAAFEGIYQCFKGGAFRASFMASEKENFILNSLGGETVKLPYGLTDATDNNTDCKQIMFGFNQGNKDGLRNGFITSDVKAPNANVTVVKSFFAGTTVGSNGLPAAGAGAIGGQTVGGIGYEATPVYENSGNTVQIKYEIAGSNVTCPSGETNPKFTIYDLNNTKIGESNAIIFPAVVATETGKLQSIQSSDIANVPRNGGETYYFTTCDQMTIMIQKLEGADFEYGVLMEGAENRLAYGSGSDGAELDSAPATLRAYGIYGGQLNIDQTITHPTASSTQITDYKLTWVGSSIGMLKGLNDRNGVGYKVSGLTDYGSLKFTKQEVFDLYYYYIVDVFMAKVVAEGANGYEGVDVNLCTDKNYKVNMTGAQQGLANVYGLDSGLHFTATVTLQGAVDALNSMGPFDDIDNRGLCNANSNNGGGNNNNGNNGGQPGATSVTTVDEGFCDDLVDEGTGGAGVGAMQWVLCPTLNNTTYTANWIDNMSQDMLEVRSNFYGPGSKTEEAWTKVRDLANVAMVIFLLIIIFSQLTGFGIDNYGIKKMLPRLVVMAIVVNLSFYICALAIDLSNIAGTGLRDIFGGIGAGLSGGAVDANTGFVSNAVVGLFSAAGIGGGAAVGAGGIAATLGAPLVVAILIAAIVLVLVVIVAIMILYLMLGAREIIIVFCVLISPLAFAAFVLPNTQNLFKKWWNLFKAAIIIFPICGVVSGISYILKDIFAGSDVGIGTKAVLMVLPFVGFFFLPMLLKEAIGALGKLGGAMANMGQTVRGGARNLGNAAVTGARNTEAFKNRQIEAARNRQLQSSQRTIDRLQQIKDNGGELDAVQTRRLARAHETQRKLGLEDQAARTILTEKEYAGRSLDDLMTDWNTAFDGGDTDRMDALTNVIVSRHGPGGVSQIANSMANKNVFSGGNFANDNMAKSFNALQANMLQNSALAGAMQNKASDVFQMLSGGGYVNGTRQNVAAHAANNGIATQMKDWATQSNGTIQRAAANGGFDAQMARSILSSTDPTIQSGIQSDKDKRATLEAIAGGYTGNWSNQADVNRAIMNYTHERALLENAEVDRVVAAQQQATEQAENLRRAADSLENLSRNQNNGGGTFQDGAGI